jgi:hypothetical protein
MYPIFISSATQQVLQICVDEDVTQESNTKFIDKEILLNDIQTNGQTSNFLEFQQHIQVDTSSALSMIIYRMDFIFHYIIHRTMLRMKSHSSTIMIISIRKIFVCSHSACLLSERIRFVVYSSDLLQSATKETY